MNPAFSSWQDFFAMGGYATSVWLAAGCALISVTGLALHTLMQRRLLLADIRRRSARERRIRRFKHPQTAPDAAGEQP